MLIYYRASKTHVNWLKSCFGDLLDFSEFAQFTECPFHLGKTHRTPATLKTEELKGHTEKDKISQWILQNLELRLSNVNFNLTAYNQRLEQLKALWWHQCFTSTSTLAWFYSNYFCNKECYQLNLIQDCCNKPYVITCRTKLGFFHCIQFRVGF